MQHVNCNICGIDDTCLIAVQNNYNVVKCRNCGLVYVNPRPDPTTVAQLYTGYHQRDGKDEYDWARLMEKNFKDAALHLNRVFPERGKILDIGCGYGHFIEIMRDFGWTVWGIDLSPKTLFYAREKGLNAANTSIDDVTFPDDFFDAITAFYVLEHLANPLSALKKVLKMLKPGGVVVIRVPHTTPIVRFLSVFKVKNNLYDIPYHLYDFSPKTISLLLKKAGFSLIRVKPGCPTLPVKFFERLTSVVSGNLAKIFFAISMGKFLMPGTSKTIIAAKELSTIEGI